MMMKNKLLLLLLLALLLSSCRAIHETQISTTDVRQTTASDAVRTSVDSIFILQRDSIYIRERGDTVFVDRWHTQIAYRDRLRTDTLRVADTVRVAVSNVIERVQGQSSWASFERWCGRILMGLLLLVGVYFFLQWKLKF
jgi:PBP1b-binding outer membrane lipoprotein LpoB